MGPVLFVGLSALALVSQGQADIEFADPSDTMRGIPFAEAPAVIGFNLLFARPTSVARVDPGPSWQPRPDIAVDVEPDRSLSAQAAGRVPNVSRMPPRTNTDQATATVLDVTVPGPDAGADLSGALAADTGLTRAFQPDRPVEVPEIGTGPEVQVGTVETAARPPDSGTLTLAIPGADVAASASVLNDGSPPVTPEKARDRTPKRQAPLVEPSVEDRLRFARRDGPNRINPPDRPGLAVAVDRQGQGPRPRTGAPDAMGVIADPTARRARVDGDFVHLRAGPGVSAARIDRFGHDTTAIVSETRGNWARVVIGDQTGWMYLRYLAFE